MLRIFKLKNSAGGNVHGFTGIIYCLHSPLSLRYKVAVSVKNITYNSFFPCKTSFGKLSPLTLITARSSHQGCSVKRRVLRNFAKFTGKHPCQTLFLNKVADLKPITLLKKRLWHRCFPVNFAKFLRTPFLTEHIRWLLL